MLRCFLHSSPMGTPYGIVQLGCSASVKVTRWGPGTREEYIIHYVLDGKGWYNGNPVKKGEGFLIYPGQLEEYHSDPSDPWEFFWIIAHGDGMRQLMELCAADPATLIFSYGFLSEVRSVCDYIRLNNRSVISPYESVELVMRLIKHHDKTPRSRPGSYTSKDYAMIAKEYLQENYSSSVTIAELMDMLGVSQPYLYKAFRQAYGCSPRQYLTDLRIGQAKSLLAHTDLRVSEVGAAVGYEDVLTFSKFFALHTGVSPTLYREQQGRGG